MRASASPSIGGPTRRATTLPGMIPRLLSLPALFAAVVLSVGLLAGCTGGWQDRVVDPRHYRVHLAWVAQEMGVPRPEMPRILVSRQALHEHTNHMFIHASMDRHSTIQAAYVPGMIILDQAGFDERSLWDLSFLVHELVHHVQFGSGRRYACPAEREREAYEIQNRWLVQMGAAPAFPETFIARLSRCDGIRTAGISR